MRRADGSCNVAGASIHQGAGLCLGAYVGASITAFLLARGVGRPLAEKVIQAEMSEEGEGGDNSILANVQVRSPLSGTI